MEYPYIVLEVPHQRPPCAWIAWDDNSVWNVLDVYAVLPPEGEDWSAGEALDYYGDDLHALQRLSPYQARAAVDFGGVLLPEHNRPASLAALREALVALEGCDPRI